MSWDVVIGLEIHIQLATKSKIFSGSSTAFGAEPNTQASAGDLALPGTLPVINKNVVRMAVMFGLAIDADITPRSVFERKHYFYPDLSSGYQVSQLEYPIVVNGEMAIDTAAGEKTIRINRAHLEEDAGKSLHEAFDSYTGIDINRGGTPLIECVSEPDLSSAKEAVAYARKLHSLVQYLGICDGNMQEGSFRVDANVSLRPSPDAPFGTRAEIKNLNSFRFMEQAINYEIDRQADILQAGGEIIQETRLFDPDAGETRSMRTKEEAQDYRYFPDPNLLPVEVDQAFIDDVRKTLPELPAQRRERYVADYGLAQDLTDELVASRAVADYFEIVVNDLDGKPKKTAKTAANWVMGELAAALNREGLDITQSQVSAAQLAQLLNRIADNTISGKIAKQVFDALWQGEGDSADAIIEAKGLKQITDSGAIEALVDQVLADNPGQVEQYKAGKTKVIGYLVGQVMKASKGKANPAEANKMLAQKMSN